MQLSNCQVSQQNGRRGTRMFQSQASCHKPNTTNTQTVCFPCTDVNCCMQWLHSALFCLALMAGSDHELSSQINVILNTNKGKQNATQASFFILFFIYRWRTKCVTTINTWKGKEKATEALYFLFTCEEECVSQQITSVNGFYPDGYHLLLRKHVLLWLYEVDPNNKHSFCKGFLLISFSPTY